ncbi:MAG TPA: hypothetical protein VHY84_08035 [Bryobacteraceae bacterium]|jgi:hypothetical protein|nr:hypothetical protein [Bryobacteraceae bacterium]
MSGLSIALRTDAANLVNGSEELDAAPSPSACDDGEYFQEMVIRAAEQMMSAARSFLRNAVISKSNGAVTSLAEMRIALIRCSAANKVWTRHLAEHACNETAPVLVATSDPG